MAKQIFFKGNFFVLNQDVKVGHKGCGGVLLHPEIKADFYERL